MKKIGLIDVDGHRFPNIALMKISAYHKSIGNSVNWYTPFEHYEVVYQSKIFSFTPDYLYPINANIVIKGGSGYALNGAGGESYCKEKDDPLPSCIEHMYPDYSLYGIQDTAYGFLTRGCPRQCDFCIVSKKEGSMSIKVANLSEFWHNQSKIVLCDPNILACREWPNLFDQLADSHAYIDFNQGLDARLLSEDKCHAINRLRLSEVHFAWDRFEDKDKVLPKLRMFADICKRKVSRHNAIVYVLVNHGTTLDQDLERIYTLRELGYSAYVMIFDKQHASRTLHQLQRWCNNRAIFWSCPDFNDYK